MYRLMIVDDEYQVVNSLYGLISGEFEMEIHKAYSSQDALRMINRMRFDIIISDISMPEHTGLDLLDMTKRLWPECHFILFSGHMSFDYAYSALKHDRVDYLLKIDSYDAIRRLITEKIALLDRELCEREKLIRIEHNLVDMRERVHRFFLKRIIVQGAALPEQKELCEVQLPLALSRPAMMAVAAMDAGGQVLQMNRLAFDAGEFLMKRLEPRGLCVMSCVSAEYALWVVQAGEQSDFSQAEQATLIQEAFDLLFQLYENRSSPALSLICANTFASVSELNDIFKRSSLLLEGMRKESGMVLLDVEALRAHRQPPPNPLDMEAVNLLWNMLRSGSIDGFLSGLRQHLSSVCSLSRIKKTLPASTVSAAAFLLFEAASHYQLSLPEETRRLLSMADDISGQAWVEGILSAARWIFAKREASQQQSEQWVIQRVDAYINEHFSEDMTLTLLAEQVHYNASYLSRFYKKHTGVNLLVRINDVRIAHAKRLLRETSIKTGEIARQCGFCSNKYFGQVFKRTTGHSPAEYRRDAAKR